MGEPKSLQLTFKSLKKDNTIHLLVIVDILSFGQKHQIALLVISFREAGYDIVYMDETWVNQNHCTDYMWLPNDGSDAPKIPSGKGKRLIVLHDYHLFFYKYIQDQSELE
jgi:hypothetical protein